MSLGTPRTIDVGGQTLAYFEQGEGPLVVCLHGYPDTAHTWDALLPALAEAGYRAVAPFMRGYHPSPPASDGDYSGLTLGREVLGLIAALGEDSAALVGHDWGASAAYSATAQAAPGQIRALVTLAIPHLRAIRPSVRGLWKARHFITYQRQKRAVARLKADDFAHVRAIYRRWSPTWDAPEAEIERVKACFRHAGVAEAALGYYWSWREEQRDAAARRTLARRVSVPSLAIGGRADGALVLETYAETPQYYEAHYDMALLDGVGHFPHREAPEAVNDLIVGFLTEFDRPAG